MSCVCVWHVCPYVVYVFCMMCMRCACVVYCVHERVVCGVYVCCVVLCCVVRIRFDVVYCMLYMLYLHGDACGMCCV